MASPAVDAGAVAAGRLFGKVVDIIERHGRRPDQLVPILQEVQEEYRYLPEEVLTYVGMTLGIPVAKVYGVATFYAHFTLKPKGKHVVRLCDGTACHVKGSIAILDAMREKLGLQPGQNTTPDLAFTVETVACLGACGLAPVIVVGADEVHGQMDAAKGVALIENIRQREQQEAAQ